MATEYPSDSMVTFKLIVRFMHVTLILSNSAVNNILRILSDLKCTVLLAFVCMYMYIYCNF